MHPRLDPSARAQPAGPNIVHESFEDEVAIADRESGRYYGLDGLGADVWRLMLARYSVHDIAVSLAGRFGLPQAEMELVVGTLLGELGEEGIVTVVDRDGRTGVAAPNRTDSAWPRPPVEPGPALPFRTDREALDAYGFFPTAGQEVLLRAALLDGERARDAFLRWQYQLDLDVLDQASFRLLPLLYQNLLRHRIALRPPLDRRLREAYRQSWFRSELLLRAVVDVLRHFSGAGMRTLLLKGVPLAIRYYPTPASRPMSDVDLLIPAGEAARALTVAREAGLAPRFRPTEWPPRFTASRSFVHPSGWEVDLHTHVMHGQLGRVADNDRWARAQPLAVGDMMTLALGPEDTVLHVIAHGLRRNALAPMRWASDAAMIVRACGPRLDWGRLLSQARASHLSLVLDRALRYLNDRLDIEIPAEVLARCAATRIGVVERVEFRSHLLAGPAGWTGATVSDWLRTRANELEWQGAAGFVRYLRDRLQLDSAWRLPGAICRSAIHRWKPGG